jgi:hypothetical protein
MLVVVVVEQKRRVPRVIDTVRQRYEVQDYSGAPTFVLLTQPKTAKLIFPRFLALQLMS